MVVVATIWDPNGTLREFQEIFEMRLTEDELSFSREKSCPYSRAENPDNGLCPICMEDGIVKFCNKEMGLLQHLRQSHPKVYNQRKAVQ
jgi:hypothetical protein